MLSTVYSATRSPLLTLVHVHLDVKVREEELPEVEQPDVDVSAVCTILSALGSVRATWKGTRTFLQSSR